MKKAATPTRRVSRNDSARVPSMGLKHFYTTRSAVVLFVAALSVAAAGCSGDKKKGSSCDLSGATPIEHTSIIGSETWESGVHHLAASLTVPAGETLTIESCSRIDLDADVNIGVTGTL